MRFLNSLKMNEESGSEPETTVEGSEQPIEVTNERPDPATDYDGWRDWQEPEETEAPEEKEEVEEEAVVEEEPEDKVEEKEEKEEKEEVEEKWVLKVEGQEVEYDPKDIEKTKEWVQKGMSAQSKWQEASKAMKQANRVVESLKSNPRSILENPALGLDMVALSKEILTEHYEMEDMNPRERELHAENRTLRQAENQKELARQQEQAREQQAYQARLNQDIQETLQTSGLPLTQDNLYRVQQYMRQAEDANIANVSPQMVIDYVKRDFETQQKEFLKSYSTEQLTELLGKDVVEAIRKQNVQAAIQQKMSKPAAKVTSSSQAKAEPKRYGSMTEYLNRSR